ncbi:MAG: aldehyde ferredoxin oxidoreductase family protein [Thermodesulfobacteriota bacterium]
MGAEKSQSGKGYWGRILVVDLTSGKAEYRKVADAVYEDYLSGVGLGAKFLWDNMKKGADPLGPDNILGFTTGVLTATPAVFAGRFTVVGKSPASGGFGDSNCGGYFAPALKKCEIDAVFVKGRAERPVYLLIDEKKASIEDAGDLWGKDAVEAEDILRERHGKKAQAAVIGQAGEKKSFMAGISTDRGRMAGRAGLGGVMGSKNLKAVVAMGGAKVQSADAERMKDLTKAFRKNLDQFKFADRFLNDMVLGGTGKLMRYLPMVMRQPAILWRGLLRKFGTPCLTAMSSEMGDSPIKNWSGSAIDFPLSRVQKIGAQAVLSFEKKKYGCYSCPIRCGGIMSVEKGPYPLSETHKPEYETICAFGALLLNDDIYSIYKINDMLNRAAMDTISCGGTVAFAMECFENGILTEKDLGGIQLSWGNADAVVKIVQKIIDRDGIGDILADGVKQAAARIGKGSEKFAVHAGGIEAPMHDPKLDPGYGMAYYCEPTPGRHTVTSLTYLDIQELEKQFSRARGPAFLSTKGERYRADNKGPALAVDSCFKMLVDCSGLCLFGTQLGGRMPVADWLNAATGWKRAPDEYLVIGERVETLRQAFNAREGIVVRRDFRPHGRLYGEPALKGGATKGVNLDIEGLGKSFHAALGWDWETGKPKKEKLQALKLGDVASELYP